MIRTARPADLEHVAALWLNTNRSAHRFIPAAYWEGNFLLVKELLGQAEVYVWEDGGCILGFIGLNGEHIEGIFVDSQSQGQGIGKHLLDFAKGRKQRLTLNVYQKNARAIRFYQREGFVLSAAGQDPDTGEADYEMLWEPAAL